MTHEDESICPCRGSRVRRVSSPRSSPRPSPPALAGDAQGPSRSPLRHQIVRGGSVADRSRHRSPITRDCSSCCASRRRGSRAIRGAPAAGCHRRPATSRPMHGSGAVSVPRLPQARLMAIRRDSGVLRRRSGVVHRRPGAARDRRVPAAEALRAHAGGQPSARGCSRCPRSPASRVTTAGSMNAAHTRGVSRRSGGAVRG